MHQGSCLCGSICYQISGDLGEFGYCHCTSCQKASGSAYGANVGVDRSDFRLSDPSECLREYESSPGKFRAFCSNCGSPLYAYLAGSRDSIRVRLGTLDTPFTKCARAHTFVADKAPWEIIADELPRFDGWAPREILEQKGSRQP